MNVVISLISGFALNSKGRYTLEDTHICSGNMSPAPVNRCLMRSDLEDAMVDCKPRGTTPAGKCGKLQQTSTLFHTDICEFSITLFHIKICDFPFLISKLYLVLKSIINTHNLF